MGVRSLHVEMNKPKNDGQLPLGGGSQPDSRSSAVGQPPQMTVGHTPSLNQQYYDPASSGVLGPNSHSLVKYTRDPAEPPSPRHMAQGQYAAANIGNAMVPYAAPGQEQAYLPTQPIVPYTAPPTASPYTALPMQEVPASSRGVGIIPLSERPLKDQPVGQGTGRQDGYVRID